MVGGGLAPLIATKLLSVGGGNPYLIMLYIGSMAVVAIIATSFMPRDHSQQALATENNKQGVKLQAKMTE
ncbi:hypothetical protein ACFOGQ_18880 [Acinetobacter vivianii]